MRLLRAALSIPIWAIAACVAIPLGVRDFYRHVTRPHDAERWP